MTIRIAISLAAVLGFGYIAEAEEKPDADDSKRRIEQPAKAIVADAVPPVPKQPVDVGKDIIELPPKRLLVEASNKAAREGVTDREFKKVAPGKVQWHKDYATAVGKSKLSNKPVLLFQLLGQLDEEFT
jgi:hypothetical protein